MTEDSQEREFQFEAPNLEAVASWITSQPSHARLRFISAAEKTQNDSYMDTADWALYRGGFSLRIRRKGETSEATLKGRGRNSTGPQSRREINQSLKNGPAGLQDESGSVSRRVRLMTGGKVVSQLFEVETRRRTIVIEREHTRLAEVSLDATRVLVDGEERRSLQRVEVEELTSGGLEEIDTFIDAMQQACNLTRAAISKFEEGLAAAGLSPSSAFDLGYDELSIDATAGEYAYAVLRGYFKDFLKHEPGTRLGEDSEELHDMRVATRKLRAAMSTFRPVLAPRLEPLREELKWIAQSLGQVRDFDVQIEWIESIQQESGWEEATALGPLIEDRRQLRDIERSKLLGDLDSDRYQTLAQSMIGALRDGTDNQGDAALPISEFGRKVLRRRHRQFRRDANEIHTGSPAEAYHEVRIRAKRLRYAADALSAVYGDRAATFITSLKEVQDLLGEHQDAAVAMEWMRQTALSDKHWPALTLLRTGELIEQRRQRMAEIRGDWPRALVQVEKQWRPLRTATRKEGKKDEPKAKKKKKKYSARQEVAVQRPLSLFRRFFRRT